MSGACRLITNELFSPERQLRLIEQYRVTHTMNATHQIVLLTKHERFNETDLSSWNNVMVSLNLNFFAYHEFIQRNIYRLAEVKFHSILKLNFRIAFQRQISLLVMA